MAAKILLPLTVAGVGIAGGTAAFATYTTYSSKRPRCIDSNLLNEKIKELREKVGEDSQEISEQKTKEFTDYIANSCKNGLGEVEEKILTVIFDPLSSTEETLAKIEKIAKTNQS